MLTQRLFRKTYSSISKIGARSFGVGVRPANPLATGLQDVDDLPKINGKPVMDLEEFMRYRDIIEGGSLVEKEIKYEHPVVDYSGLKIDPIPYELYSKSKIPELLETKLAHRIGDSDLLTREYLMKLVAAATVLPMRANNYVCDQLIDWDNVPNDPIFRLTFPQPEMLDPTHINEIAQMLLNDESKLEIREKAEQIRNTMNPHPAGQKQMNVPSLRLENEGINYDAMPGMQHKYRETALFFPTESQYCHAFCTYCFRWAQFTAVGSEQAFASKDAELLHTYLSKHKDLSDLLFTGGDPMVMTARQFSRYVDPIILDPAGKFDHINTIRIGTKALAYWPYRFVTDNDADDMLRVFERIVASGRQVSIMAHFSHWVELSTPVVQEAIRRIRLTGANVRTQAPLIRHVNDDARVWAEKWRLETRLGCIPYYMFVERDTGARNYFELPLYKCHEIFRDAYAMQSGLGRTVRGPSMSCTPGKVHVMGVIDVPKPSNPKETEKAFLLQFLQARDPAWVAKPFLAKYDEKATWFDDLKPFYGDKFFFEDSFDDIKTKDVSSGQLYSHGEGGQLGNYVIPPGLTHDMKKHAKQMEKEREAFIPRK